MVDDVEIHIYLHVLIVHGCCCVVLVFYQVFHRNTGSERVFFLQRQQEFPEVFRTCSSTSSVRCDGVNLRHVCVHDAGI